MTKSVSTPLFRIAFLAVAALFIFSSIVAHASTATVTPGKKVTLSVAANGTAPFNYQWKKNGVNISGATSSTYVISGVQLQNAGNYTVAVSNAAGSTTSDVGTLTVVAGVADINGDGRGDLIWEDTVTGDRGIWLMNADYTSTWVYLGKLPTEWRIAGAADFNGDGRADLIWDDRVTGDHGIWLMNADYTSTWVYLGKLPTEWRIAGAADFNGDGKSDLVWEDTVTGDRGIWLMNADYTSTWVYLGKLPTEWRIAQ